MFRLTPCAVLTTLALTLFATESLFAETNSFASPKYQALLESIDRVHTAMRAAAATPNSRRRRREASEAIQKLPQALSALAEEYRNGKLDGHDFPRVWRVVGKFVDPSAAERYRRFLEKPDRRWIPQWPTTDSATPSPKSSSTWDEAIRWARRLASITILPTEARAEGELGALASAILMGVAAIIQAKSPEKVAKIQAQADVMIASINSDTQKYMTDQVAGTSKYLADQQKSIAIFQSNLSRTIASEQQANVNYRLDRQLAELKIARKDAEAVQTAVRNKEWEYNERRLQIAEQQAKKNYELADEAMKAQLTAAGLSSGFANSFDSGNQLTTASSLTPIGGVGGTGAQALEGNSGRGAVGPSATSGTGPSLPAVSGSAATSPVASSATSLSLSEIRAASATSSMATASAEGPALSRSLSERSLDQAPSVLARAEEKRASDRLLGRLFESVGQEESEGAADGAAPSPREKRTRRETAKKRLKTEI